MPSVATNIVFVYVNSCMRLLRVESTMETCNKYKVIFVCFIRCSVFCAKLAIVQPCLYKNRPSNTHTDKHKDGDKDLMV